MVNNGCTESLCLGGSELGSGASQTWPGMRFLVGIFPGKPLQALCMLSPLSRGGDRWWPGAVSPPAALAGALGKSMGWKELSMDRTGGHSHCPRCPHCPHLAPLSPSVSTNRRNVKFGVIFHIEEMFSSSFVVMWAGTAVRAQFGRITGISSCPVSKQDHFPVPPALSSSWEH